MEREERMCDDSRKKRSKSRAMLEELDAEILALQKQVTHLPICLQ
jgi:hypothetical protein